eukprot:1532323-Amphidinium_carterae.1
MKTGVWGCNPSWVTTTDRRSMQCCHRWYTQLPETQKGFRRARGAVPQPRPTGRRFRVVVSTRAE